MDIALWPLVGWFAMSALASPIIGLLGRVNDGEAGECAPAVSAGSRNGRARRVTPR